MQKFRLISSVQIHLFFVILFSVAQFNRQFSKIQLYKPVHFFKSISENLNYFNEYFPENLQNR